jgi:tetratricopeptide (TPR) repeat protein
MKAKAATVGACCLAVTLFAASLFAAPPACAAPSAHAAPPACADDEPAGRIERAVVLGSVADLSAIKRTLETTIEAKGGPAGLDDYTLAYVGWRLCQILDPGEGKEKRRLLKEAQQRLEIRLERIPDDAEASALLGSVFGEQIDGFFGGMFLGPKAEKRLERALALAPQNPRVALQRAISHYFTPRTFGGGLDRAEAEARRAVTLFESEPADRPWPNWGRVDALAWLGLILKKSDRPDEARAAWEAALALEPEHAWVRDKLLPGLDGGVTPE